MSKQNAPLVKVGVLRHDRETVHPREFPNDEIICAAQPALMNVTRIRIRIGERINEAGSEVFVEEKLHTFEISSLRSRSAA